MPREPFYETEQQPRTLLLAVHSPHNKTENIQAYYHEFLSLVRTNEQSYEHIMYVKLRTVDGAYFFTSGKLEQIKETCEKYEIEQIIISESLSPQQERNLEDYLDCPIIDRTQLILEIFEKSAHSTEGKTQVHIAMLQHAKTRLAGKGIFLEQQKGIAGLRGGAGEKLKEKERRHIEREVQKLRKKLATIERARQTQRKLRDRRQIPHISLIGYTNAGKSTILNALTKSDVLAEDKLFATLDTTTRALFVDGKQKGVISDTVGFIQQLPHQLIEAFKSTLSELGYADLLLQVVDVSDESWPENIQVVNQILHDLKVEKPMLYVFNKIDQAEDPEDVEHAVAYYRPHVIVNATTKEGLEPLKEWLVTWSPRHSSN